MGNKKSKIETEIFTKAREKLLTMFPQVSKKAFYISNFKNSKVFPKGWVDTYESIIGEITRNPFILRAHRKLEGVSLVKYKVDELNIETKKWRATHNKIKGHRIENNISEDMMERNQMTVDFISDDNGNLKPNIQPDGMVKVYINFPDPIEELKRSLVKKN